MADEHPSAQSIDFYTFCLSLGSSAFVHLGDVPDPETGQPVTNLVMARQSIEILSMLREKTKGNLLEHEEKLLDQLLVDLKLRFVARASGKAE